MRVKLIILILQTLKHFNDVLDDLRSTAHSSFNVRQNIDVDYRNTNKKLRREIEYQKSKLVK